VKKELSLGGDMYFLDLRNHVAHVAKVAWNRSNRSGLSFIRSYELDAPLPPQMTFLKRLFLEATLRQVQKLIKCGISSEEAAALVGLTKDQLERLNREGRTRRSASYFVKQSGLLKT